MATQPPPQKGAEPPIFGACLLRPNGCMDQDATWYRGRLRLRQHCVRGGPGSPPQKKGQSSPPQFSAHVHYGQTAGWIKMALDTKVGLGPRHIVIEGEPAALPKKGAEPSPIFGPFLLWLNGWMDQDATWYGGRPQPRRLFVRWVPSPPLKKWRSHPIFGPRLLWPNGCMDQDTAWCGRRRRPTRHCVRRGPSCPPLKGHSPQFSAIVRCGQTAGWTKMPLDMEVDLGSGDFVFDGDWGPSYLQKKGTPTPPNCWPMSVVAKRLGGWTGTPLGTED